MGEILYEEGSRRALLMQVETLIKKAIAKEELYSTLPEDPKELESLGTVIDEAIKGAKDTLEKVRGKAFYVEQWQRVLGALSELKERYDTRDKKGSE